mmetsp:Transcript_22454/g.66584  ORF Transcript_22454/g.66584 Transcript_22454/m.66584 type:complete len:211 (-) Transcript_22454:1946-2578(-)
MGRNFPPAPFAMPISFSNRGELSCCWTCTLSSARNFEIDILEEKFIWVLVPDEANHENALMVPDVCATLMLSVKFAFNAESLQGPILCHDNRGTTVRCGSFLTSNVHGRVRTLRLSHISNMSISFLRDDVLFCSFSFTWSSRGPTVKKTSMNLSFKRHRMSLSWCRLLVRSPVTSSTALGHGHRVLIKRDNSIGPSCLTDRAYTVGVAAH